MQQFESNDINSRIDSFKGGVHSDSSNYASMHTAKEIINHTPLILKYEHFSSNEVKDEHNVNMAKTLCNNTPLKFLPPYHHVQSNQHKPINHEVSSSTNTDSRIFSISGKIKNKVVYLDVRDSKTDLQINVELLSKEDREKIRFGLTSNMQKWNEFLNACKYNEIDEYAKTLLIFVFDSMLPNELKHLRIITDD